MSLAWIEKTLPAGKSFNCLKVLYFCRSWSSTLTSIFVSDNSSKILFLISDEILRCNFHFYWRNLRPFIVLSLSNGWKSFTCWNANGYYPFLLKELIEHPFMHCFININVLNSCIPLIPRYTFLHAYF